MAKKSGILAAAYGFYALSAAGMARAIAVRGAPWASRSAVVAVGLLIWFRTQALIGRRRPPEGRIDDAVHRLTAPWNEWLNRHPRQADRLLIGTSALIDLTVIFVIVSALFGESMRPFAGLIVLFALRQASQWSVSLPPPPGMIWRQPLVPSLLVTYGVDTDLFFSGHTAMAVYGALELARLFGPMGAAIGAGLVALETATVLVLRAHYTMDVFCAFFVAWFAQATAGPAGTALDALIAGIRL